jgi:hypothetical protein
MLSFAVRHVLVSDGGKCGLVFLRAKENIRGGGWLFRTGRS